MNWSRPCAEPEIGAACDSPEATLAALEKPGGGPFRDFNAEWDQAVAYFDSQGLNHEFFSPVGTDAISFNNVGIPASGLLTGQDCCKTQQEVDLFGGHVGNFEGNVPSFDGGCVDNPFRWCDNLSNNDPTVLTFMSKAFADMTVRMAFDTKIMSASNDYVSKGNLTAPSGARNHPAQ